MPGTNPSFWQLIVPTLVGGTIADSVAILGIGLTYKNNLKLNARQKQSKINGILRAIRYELEVVAEYYGKTAGLALKQVPDGQPYQVYFSLTEKYFIVYPHNTEIIGQINDQALCKAIVVTYNRANFLLELFRINNWYLDKLNEFAFAQKPTGPLWLNAIGHAKNLQDADKALSDATGDLLSRIDAYLAQHDLSR